MVEVSEVQVDAALQELLHERNRQGDDGCFGCGSTAHWGPKQIHGRIPFYREMLKRILEAAGQAHAPSQVHQVQTPPQVQASPPSVPRRRANVEAGSTE